MTSPSAHDLLPDELEALMHFYAEAGVAWLSEDFPIDRFAEPAAPAARPQASVVRLDAPEQSTGATRPARAAPAPQVMVAPTVAVPDAEAVEAGRALAASAGSPEDLIAALESFSACNLKFSARHTVFAAGSFAPRVVVVGGVPAADDDREGRPFSGPAGEMLNRMTSGIGLDAATLLTVNVIPWRTPGDRAPTVREVDICRPFALRMIELVKPAAVLVLGNLSARAMLGEPRAGIHAARGKWVDIEVGTGAARAFATFHPQELLGTPASKRLAWQDLMLFRAGIDAS